MQYSKMLVKTLSLSLLVSSFSASASDNNSKLVTGLKLGGALAGAGLAVASLYKLNVLRTEPEEARLTRLLSKDAVKLGAPIAFVGAGEEVEELNAQLKSAWDAEVCKQTTSVKLVTKDDGTIDPVKTKKQFVDGIKEFRKKVTADHQHNYIEAHIGRLRAEMDKHVRVIDPQKCNLYIQMFQSQVPNLDDNGRLSTQAVWDVRKALNVLAHKREFEQAENEVSKKEQAALSQELRRAVSEASKQREAAANLLSVRYQEDLRHMLIEASKKEQAAQSPLLAEILRADDAAGPVSPAPSPSSLASGASFSPLSIGQ